MNCFQRLLLVLVFAFTVCLAANLANIRTAEASLDTGLENVQSSLSGEVEMDSIDRDSHNRQTENSGSEGHGDTQRNLGLILPLWSCVPFAGMLLSIALFPLLAGEFWHHHFGKVSFFWAAVLGIPCDCLPISDPV